VTPRLDLRGDAARIWGAALRAVDPVAAVRRCFRRRGHEVEAGGKRFVLSPSDRVWVIGAGKAAAPMARALETILGRRLSGGIVVTKYGHTLPPGRVTQLEAGHPLPDENGIAGSDAIEGFIRNNVSPRDLVCCVLSGGGSALLPAPAPGISLADKLQCTSLLLRGGATIHEINAVRKHLSRLKGGGLARLLPGNRVVSLILSDVVGDSLDTIASGPLVPDPTTFEHCREVLSRLRLLDRMPERVRRRIEEGADGKIPETPKPGDAAFRGKHNVIVGSSAIACTAAAREARRLGYRPLVLSSRLEGDTAEAARFHMSVADEIAREGRPLKAPACIVSGGETTVHVIGSGKGGRNQEFVLHCVRPLASVGAPCLAASVGTDGTDGPTDAAGALADNSSLARSLKRGAGFLESSMADNDSYTFFDRLGDLVITGPTRTNVMDLRIVLIR
jgi:glycerate 2-kinase